MTGGKQKSLQIPPGGAAGETGGAASFASIQWFAMMLFDEHDLDCWIILAILSLIMACPQR